MRRFNLIAFTTLLALGFMNQASLASYPKEEREKEKEDESPARRNIAAPEAQPPALEVIPTGGIIPFAGEAAPYGWLLCDGQRYSSLNYPELYEVVKTKYIPESEQWIIKSNEHSTIEKFFHVPDLRGRVIVGVDSGAARVKNNNTLGNNGGEENTIISVNNLPSHSFKININKVHASNQGSAKREVFTPDDVSTGYPSGEWKIHTTNTQSLGENQPHNNMQPYLILHYIINAGKMSNLPDSHRQDQRIEELEQHIRNLEISQKKYATFFDDLEVRQRLNPSCAKAWVAFNGSGSTIAILDGYGVSSVIKNSIGDYTVKFLKPFKSQNYCCALNAKGDQRALAAGLFTGIPQTQHDVRFKIWDHGTHAAADSPLVSACFYGTQ